MAPRARLRLSGFGGTHAVEVAALRPEREHELVAAVGAAGPEGLLAHGGGRSYGDCALPAGATAVLTRRLDRFVAFDPASGELVCEGGVTMGELVRVLLPRGFLPHACPGTAWATVGGAIANDVHGKDQASVGSFGAHVRWLDLLLASGEVVRVSPAERPALFRATVGGIGLTGIIVRACLALARTPGSAVAWRTRPVADLDALLAALDDAVRSAPYQLAWVDGTARGARLGRGAVESAEPLATTGELWLPRAPVGAAPAVPRLLFTPRTMAAVNAWRLARARAERGVRTLDVGRYFFPLDGSQVYARVRLCELHAVFPEDDQGRGLRRVLEGVADSGIAPLLVVVKRFGHPGVGDLSFALAGHSLVVDLPAGDDTRALLARLEEIVVAHGGRIYLAKDGSLSADHFARMYPRLPAFRRVLAEVDPAGAFRSELAARLGVRGGGPA